MSKLFSSHPGSFCCDILINDHNNEKQTAGYSPGHKNLVMEQNPTDKYFVLIILPPGHWLVTNSTFPIPITVILRTEGDLMSLMPNS